MHDVHHLAHAYPHPAPTHAAPDTIDNSRRNLESGKGPDTVEPDAVELLQYLARHPSIDADTLCRSIDADAGRPWDARQGGRGGPVVETTAGDTTARLTPYGKCITAYDMRDVSMEDTRMEKGRGEMDASDTTDGIHAKAQTRRGPTSKTTMEPRTPPSSILPDHQQQQSTVSTSAVVKSLPHAQFLTAPHMRTGKGGRKPSIDPRMDPSIDPKKAKRILANRLSAAKSTLKKKQRMEVLTARIDALMQTRAVMESEVAELELRFCAEVQRNAELKRLIFIYIQDGVRPT